MSHTLNTRVVRPRGSIRFGRTVKAKNAGVVIPEDVNKQSITVTPDDAEATQNLGNGFYRFSYTYDIDPNSFFTFFFNGRNIGGRNYKPVSGGWWVENNLRDILYVTTNYSSGDYNWVTSLFSPYNYTRSAQFVIIAKL
ncbi:hypothetical protein [Paenibacillus agilis]|uniref:Uncharacterized protein n=1 Tax=Paenibacillus agilis TaxID=3020863 RepID=A0A559IC63_9BACL|nr:hypothetical protein [Paenibacillus agilis]TVX85247.1 hypothetical protein FPZ44_25330 [Paenibacillus agilis]